MAVTKHNDMNESLLHEGGKGEIHPHSAYAKKISLIITALSNFSVQFNFQAVAVALLVMSASVCTSNDDECRENEQAAWVSGAATSTVFIGCIAGQLSMGYVGDLLGRNTAMCMTLSITALGALGSALCSFGSAEEIYIIIIAFRFILGIGAGGVYPLSATKAAEDSSKHGDSGKVNPVAAGRAFFWQAPGAMTPWIVGYILSFSSMAAETKWRLLLGLGFIPATIIVFLTAYEMKLRGETFSGSSSPVKKGKAGGFDPLADAASKRQDELMADGHYRLQLLVTGGCWFIYDVAFYGVALFGGDIVNSMKSSDDDNVSSNGAIRYATSQEMLALSMGIPASIMTIYWIKNFGTKVCQVYGFIFQGVCFFMLSVCFFPLMDSSPGTLLFLYCLLLFSLNSGPSMTTFVLPAETFPREIRATFNGISAASGKAGAAVGAYMFGPMASATTYPTVMVVCGVLCVIGAVISQVYIPSQDESKGYEQLERTVRSEDREAGDDDVEDIERLRYMSR